MNIRKGLLWEEHPFRELQPKWTIEPSIEDVMKLVRRELEISNSDPCVVQFLAQGAFNKVYTVTCGSKQEYVMRVSLPVDPRLKTMSEVATIEYIRHHTDIPVPEVLRHQATNTNELEFEWMLMTRVPGHKLQDQWNNMSWLKKELLLPTSDIPDATLLGADSSTVSTQFCLSKIVSMPFFWGKHVDCDVPRAPYKRSRDWLAVQLQLQLIDLENEEVDEDDSDCEDPEEVKRRAQRLFDLLPKIFPDKEVETYVVHHNDLNANNILVDENGDLTGIIDWECIHTSPLWLACQIPKFLEHDMERHEPPNLDDFPIYTQDDGTEDRNEMFYERLDEYEKTRLWRFFKDEMERVCPEWVEAHYCTLLKVGFEQVVRQFDCVLSSQQIDRWISNVEKYGIPPTLRYVFRNRQDAINNYSGEGPLEY